MSETIVQKKLGERVRRELSHILSQPGSLKGSMVTISVVRMTADLSIAKVYVSIFPDTNADEKVKELNKDAWDYRHKLAKTIRNEVRKIPEVRFLLDDSFQEAEKIERLLNDAKIDPDE